MSAGTHGATDILGLGADWEAQDTNLATTRDRISSPAANGDESASTTFGEQIEVAVPYIYVGAETDLGAALDAALSAVGVNVGQLAGTYLITGISVDLSPLAEGKRAMISFVVVNGFAAASAVYKPSVTISLVVGSIPDILTNSDADSELTSEKYAIAASHGTDRDADGEIIRGSTYGGSETLELEFYGVPTLVTTGWDIPSEASRDSNADYSASSFSLIKGLAREV